MSNLPSLVPTIYNTKSYSQKEVYNLINPNLLGKFKLFLAYFLIVFLVLGSLYGFVKWGFTETLVIEGDSMVPTFLDKDKIFIEKWSSSLKGYKRGDIVVARINNKLVVKRVIGLEQEIIELKNKKVYLYSQLYPQGTLLIEEYLQKINDKESVPTCKIPDCSIDNDKTFVNKNQFYLMGDSRETSNDSRNFGQVDRSLIVGKVYQFISKNGQTMPVLDPKYGVSKF